MNKYSVVGFLGFIFLLLSSFFFEHKKMYFVSGTPTPLSGVNFSSKLYRLEGDNIKSLKVVREISKQGDGVDSIRSYYDDGLVVIASPSVRPERLSIIKMDNTESESFINIKDNDCLSCSFIESHLIKLLDEKLIFFSVFGKDGISYFDLWGLEDGGRQSDKDISVLKNILASGIPGSAIPGDAFYMDSDADGVLYVFIAGSKVKTDWTLPKEYRFSNKDVIVSYINTKNMLVLSSKDNKKRSYDDLGSSTYYFFNKKSNLWGMVVFPGGRTEIRGFKNWIVGYVADMGRDIDNPGIENRRKEMAETGSPFDWRADVSNVFMPGELFLFDIESNQRYVIKTGQADSEILLVDGGFLYYRVNDEIFKKKIYDQDGENKELLIKSNLVPDIHWAFMGF